MPELPEVETIRKGLSKYFVGHKIEDIDINTPKVFTGDPKDVISAKVKDIRRFAKVLSVDLSNRFSLLIHIKMTGQLIYRGPNLPKPPVLSPKILGLAGKHTHVFFKLDRGGFLYYNDVRKFGWIKIVKTSEVGKSDFIEKLGPEPLKDLTFLMFQNILHEIHRPIKVVLMDQEKIGGVGNIYANDALWLSKIHPECLAHKLSGNQAIKLYESLEEVLKEGIKRGGSSEFSYVTVDGGEGRYQEQFLVYGQDGQLCARCHKAKIQKIKLSGRGTYFCPKCQK